MSDIEDRITALEKKQKENDKLIEFLLSCSVRHESAVHQMHLPPKDRLLWNRHIGRENWPAEDQGEKDG